MKHLATMLALILFGITPRSTVPEVFTATKTAINVHIGQTFVIGLTENASTGYSWRMTGTLTQAQLAYLGTTHLAANSTRVGAPGTSLYIFTARQAGSYKLTFTYSRPWEQGVPAAQTVTFSVSVTPAS